LHGYHIGIAVLDTGTGRLYGSGDYEGTFASESIVKVFIATRLLVTGQMHGATQRAAYKMITQSDDAIATRLWPRVGGPRLIPWIKAHYRVPNLGSPPRLATWWGNTRIVPEGLVRLYAKLKEDPKVHWWLLHAMHHAHKFGSDGQYQYFGIPSATRHAAIKQGWGTDYDDWPNRANFNTSGYVNHDRYTMAILARGPISTYGTEIGNLLTAVARRLMPHGQFPLTPPRIFRTSAAAGPTRGGNRITIYGENFNRVRRVLFGRTAGKNLDVRSSHVIKVDAPPHRRGEVGLHVVTAYGQNWGTHYRYIQPPVVTDLGKHDGTVTGGHRLTVTGASFKNVRRVLFGSTPALDVNVRSPQQIQVSVPRHNAGTVHVRVVTAYGWSTPTERNAYRYHSPPSLAAMSPTSGPTAGGNEVTLTGKGFGRDARVFFGKVRVRNVRPSDGGKALSVRAPQHRPGRFHVTVKTAWGRTGGVQYTFVPLHPRNH
jgi:hypothetical protein